MFVFSLLPFLKVKHYLTDNHRLSIILLGNIWQLILFHVKSNIPFHVEVKHKILSDGYKFRSGLSNHKNVWVLIPSSPQTIVDSVLAANQIQQATSCKLIGFRGGSRNLSTHGLELPIRGQKWLKSAIFLCPFAQFPSTRTKDFLWKLNASNWEAVAPSPSLGATTDRILSDGVKTVICPGSERNVRVSMPVQISKYLSDMWVRLLYIWN